MKYIVLSISEVDAESTQLAADAASMIQQKEGTVYVVLPSSHPTIDTLRDIISGASVHIVKSSW